MEVHRLAAFSDDPRGGNPAGVVIGRAHPRDDDMQRVAAEIGYSETAFLAEASDREFRVRYFSPAAEVDFCGHATIAAGVLLGEQRGTGTYSFLTNVGTVPVVVERRSDGRMLATLTSVAPRHRPADEGLVEAALAALGWRREELDVSIPPAMAFAGAWHLVLAAGSRRRLARLEYDFDALREVSRSHGIVTFQLVWREDPSTFHARDPFPAGGVVEDPATGAAAAALGGYLRDIAAVEPPVQLTVRQGIELGRPSLLIVGVPREGGIRVSGTAAPDPS